MKENRKVALDYLFRDEAGYAERPEEGGGAVNRGITFDTFKAWRGLTGSANVEWKDLELMSRDEAEQIYDQQWLPPIHFDELPAGVDYLILDASVLGGVSGATKILQAVLGFKGGEIDGHFGLNTRWAVQHRDPAKLIADICAARLARYRMFKKKWNTVAIPATGRTWGQIWAARINTVQARSLKICEASK